MKKSLMKLTSETVTGFWNDSCDLNQLSEALEHGAVGATSNPVIVSAVVKSAPELWNPLIDRLILDHPTATEDDVVAFNAEFFRQRLPQIEPATIGIKMRGLQHHAHGGDGFWRRTERVFVGCEFDDG